MSEPRRGTVSGHRVTVTLEGCHPLHTDYPLLPGDILVREKAGTWYKVAPGLGIIGFRLTAEQQATLEPVIHQPVSLGGLDTLAAAAVTPPGKEPA